MPSSRSSSGILPNKLPLRSVPQNPVAKGAQKATFQVDKPSQMSSDAIITVEGLGKRYRLGAGRSNERYTALRDVLSDKVGSIFRCNDLTSDRRPLTSDH